MTEVKKEQDQKNNQLSAGEVSYICFFCVLLFAKGIGLYDGQKYFIPFLVLAYLFWGIKMCITKYTVKEIFIITVLLLLGVLSYLDSEDKSALIAVMTVVGMKGVKTDKLFKFGGGLWFFTFATTVTLALVGVWPTVQVVHNKGMLGYVIRNSLGMTHPNVLHISYMVLIAFLFLNFRWKGKAIVVPIVFSILGSFYIFMYSLSYTGLAFFFAYVVLIIYFNLPRKITKVENIFIQCLMPVCIIIALIGPIVLKGRAFDIIDKLVNTRFRLSKYYLTTVIPRLWGQKMYIDGGFAIDCSYLHCLYYYGIILFVFFIIGFFFLIRHLLKEERKAEVAMVLGLIAAGFTEPFLFNFSFKNLIFPLLGEYMFELLEQKKNIGKLKFLEKDIQLIRVEKNFSNRLEYFFDFMFRQIKKEVHNREKWILTSAFIGLLIGIMVSSKMPASPTYVIVNKDTSDRVGGRYDYLIYEDLEQEIIDNSIKLNIYGEDTKVYVFSGNIIAYENFRNKVSIMVYSMLGAILIVATVLCVISMKKNRMREHYLC